SHHGAVNRESDQRVHVTVPSSGASQPGNFMLTYVLEQKEGAPSMAFLAYPDKDEAGQRTDDGYFMLLLGLPSAERSEAFPPREVTLVIDRSGSMRGEKIEQAKAAAMQVIEALDDGESFNIIDYSDSISMFAERAVVRSAETVEQARAYVESIRAIGGTNIHDALTRAVATPPREGAVSIVLFLTDGLPTVGQTNEVAIRDAVKGANEAGRRVFTFGVGTDVNVPLLSGISGDSRATSSFVLPDEDVEVKVGKVFRQLHGPVLAFPTLEVMSPDGKIDANRLRDVQPRVLPDLFASDQLVIFGRYVGDEPLQVVLGGSAFGEDIRHEFSFNVAKASLENVFVPRLWATRQIASLTDQIREHGASGVTDPDDPRVKELIDEVIRLSLEFGILTEYTAFLAAEEDAAVALGDGRTRRRVLEEAERISETAMRDRSGAGAVRRQLELQAQTDRGVMNKLNRVVGDDYRAVESLAICQTQDQTLYMRNGRWIDARVMQKASVEPDEVVEFASDRYFTICNTLIDEGRQSVLAFNNEILIDFEGRNVLLAAPN
ncbi:MAG: VWA domain-containing protein, partial [Phycisphaerales bacterium]|nr:VWA domain-containing protein [Phycisphaerales bacterium]